MSPSAPRKVLLWVFIAVSAGYALLAWDRLAGPSPQFHFVDLAHSLMAGRLATDTPSAAAQQRCAEGPRGYCEAIERSRSSGGWNDWITLETLTLEDGTRVQGQFPWAKSDGENQHIFHTIDGEARKIRAPDQLARTCGESGRRTCREQTYYISFPPMPAVVLLPFAAIWGYDTNDVLITLLFGGLNAVLLLLFLQLLVARGHSSRTTSDNLWLTALFAFGSVVFFSSVRGEVWFSALVFGVTFNLLYMLAALDTRRPALAGLLLALGMATRTPVAFCFVFFGWQLFFPGNRWQPGRVAEILSKGVRFSVPILVVGGALIAYNIARFGEPLEFGHSYLGGGAGPRIRDHGLFSTWFLNLNLQAALVNVPRLSSEAPYLHITKHGLSLLFTTPALLLLLRPARMPALGRALWLAVGCAAAPGLLYQNTGWEQFGYRFAMDYLPYLVALLAVGGRPLTGPVKAVILLGVAINLFGAITFGRFPDFYY